MSFIRTILLLGIALSNPALATDEDSVHSRKRPKQPAAEAALSGGAPPLHARGPGALFASIEAAAVDALTYAHLQALEARDTARIRGGTIHTVDGRYSYGQIQRGNPLTPHRISYRFGPHEVARFHAYPVYQNPLTNRANERLSSADRRSVGFIDPLHRPLYVLHPSLAIRVYRGEGFERAEVANLRHPVRVPLFAGN
ncbi:MAG: hypothetical protein JRE57_00395 [Deltaproteobacteria bacterium]|nr:hypothetical protein [Deltaproteobacteria bacterium]